MAHYAPWENLRMRLALLSDIHANLFAMDACLARARRLGVDRVVLLGDLVGYGPDPGGVVDRARELAAQGAIVIRGNHDALAVSPPAKPETVDEAGAGWTHDQLDADQLGFLAALPLTHVDAPCLFVHASADAPQRWRYVSNPIVARDSLDCATQAEGVRYVLGGHVHLQALYYEGRGSQLMLFEPTPGRPIPVPRHRRWLATVGSVGQPRDGRQDAAFALLDLRRAELCFFRIPYDVGATIAAARRKGLAQDAIQRLERAR